MMPVFYSLRGGYRMWVWARRLWTGANLIKTLGEWLLILAWVGVPGATGAIAFFKDQPWDIVVLYVMFGLAWWLVIYVEAQPLLADYAERRTRGNAGLTALGALLRESGDLFDKHVTSAVEFEQWEAEFRAWH